MKAWTIAVALWGATIAGNALAQEPEPAVPQAQATTATSTSAVGGPKLEPVSAPPAPLGAPSPRPLPSDESLTARPRDQDPSRRIAISINPLTLHLMRFGGNAEFLLLSHHVIVGTLFYANNTTNPPVNTPFSMSNPQLEDSIRNQFRGIGGEIGYRYYSGEEGPRGVYLGLSLLLGSYKAIPLPEGLRGNSISFTNIGAALDVGYQALVAGRWVVGLGAGLQYTVPSETFPQQELTASVYANKGLRPRLLLSLGVAL